MLPILILVGSLAPASAVVPSESGAATVAIQQNAEYEQRRKAAGKDVEKLWELHLWCESKGLDKESRLTLRKIVQIDPDHEDANTALGHVKVEGKWFPSAEKAEAYRKEQEETAARAKGFVRYGEEWVDPADVIFLERGLARNEQGVWFDPVAEEKRAAGWILQDTTWIPPDEREHVEKGEWKCGEEWLGLEDANRYHADPETWWRIPGEHVTLFTTCDRKLAVEWVLWNLEQAWKDLVRAYGVEPERPMTVLVLRDQGQYEKYAAGNPDASVLPTESHGLSSVHYAYFADLGFDMEADRFLPMGVSYWDASTKAGNRWGVHAVRHAMGQSFAEAVDPSPRTMAKVRESREPDPDAFWAEKRLPAWLRWGAAAYAERYYVDSSVGPEGNPLWAREWSVSNIVARGGLRPLKEVFRCEITNAGGPDSQKLINEVGLVMAFVLDGECAPVQEKHAALTTAIREKQDAEAITKAAKALQSEVERHEPQLRKFAGI